MRRYLAIIFSALTLLLLVTPITVSAAGWSPFGDVCQSKPDSLACKGGGDNPISGKGGVILKAASLVALVVGIASVIMIILGGLRYILSGGDSNKINTAKNQIIYACIGIAVAALAQTIIAFVASKL
jgi:hypothetical protein